MNKKIYAHLQPDDHLLEIGPGTGGFTQLLAPYVREITLIERAMQQLAKRNILPPKAILTKWEDAPELEADIVFGANAFYRIREMKAGLLKMHETARRQTCRQMKSSPQLRISSVC
ncbi:rRNA adenine N-6-methyltransferase family protein [Paenibacillus whitsoniae]|uniref:Methyltransferase domain-containing protein n=1 Tax=Paenibacillus whitsoniae TaxID=2496558 RepID=A0A430JA79_9BACL|nr:rRNA adenine N-6-methyltransferase family protein [Paenibacillus whitsoniae]RTE07831.1 hypothetical protein EJQ19_20515 [Paenibacillus whitsoniae]